MLDQDPDPNVVGGTDEDEETRHNLREQELTAALTYLRLCGCRNFKDIIPSVESPPVEGTEQLDMEHAV